LCRQWVSYHTTAFMSEHPLYGTASIERRRKAQASVPMIPLNAARWPERREGPARGHAASVVGTFGTTGGLARRRRLAVPTTSAEATMTPTIAIERPTMAGQPRWLSVDAPSSVMPPPVARFVHLALPGHVGA